MNFFERQLGSKESRSLYYYQKFFSSSFRSFYQNKRFLHPKDSREFLNLKKIVFKSGMSSLKFLRQRRLVKLCATPWCEVRLNEIERSFVGYDKKKMKIKFFLFLVRPIRSVGTTGCCMCSAVRYYIPCYISHTSPSQPTKTTFLYVSFQIRWRLVDGIAKCILSANLVVEH